MKSPFDEENSTKEHLNIRLPQNFDLSNMLSCTLLTKDKQTESLWGGFTCFSSATYGKCTIGQFIGQCCSYIVPMVLVLHR